MTMKQTHPPQISDAMLPSVHFGSLEDLVAELAWPPRLESTEDALQGSFPPILRVTTQYYHLPTGMGVKYHTVKIIVTALAQPVGDPCPHTFVWVWQVDDYETWQGSIPPGSSWRLAHSYALLKALEGEVRAWLSEKTGLEVRKGMYCVPASYHDIPGMTELFNLAESRARIQAEMPALPDELLTTAHRVRAILREEPSCEDYTLLQLFWGKQGYADAGSAREELRMVRAYLAFLERQQVAELRSAQAREG